MTNKIYCDILFVRCENLGGKMIVLIDKLQINLTEDFRRIEKMPDDPENCEVFGYMTDESNCLLYLIPNTDNFFDGDLGGIVDGIHNSLAENQGLIEVADGKTLKGGEYVYSIVKTVDEEMGTQYCLTLDYKIDDRCVTAQGFFSERGVVGMRDGVIMADLLNRGDLDESLDGWLCDPYDKAFDRGILKNLSEDEKYDRDFPNHPLTKAREFIKFFAAMN